MTLQAYLDRYKRESILATPQEELIPLLYDRGVTHLRTALERWEEQDTVGFGIHLRKAQAIVAELVGSLDRAAGGEIARNLERLYNYMIQRLVDADMKKDPAGVREAMDLLAKLEEGWLHAMAQHKER